MFPLIHMGRPWFAYWLYPFPNIAGVWPQFRSPLTWDVFAVTTYFTVSLVFWYVGLIPDLAALRDQAKKRWQRIVYGLLALGWRGSAIHWRRYEKVYLILGRHQHAAGALACTRSCPSTSPCRSCRCGTRRSSRRSSSPGPSSPGFAMVVVLAIPMRKWYKLEDFFTDHHLDIMGKVMLATGLLVTYGYFSEVWMAWYGHSALRVGHHAWSACSARTGGRTGA